MRTTIELFRVILFLVFFLGSSATYSETKPKKEFLLFLDIHPDCATLDNDAQMYEALLKRIPQVFIVRSQVTDPNWVLTWLPEKNEAPKKDSITCNLKFSGGSENLIFQLGPDANPAQIELAASRIAWVASFREKKSVPKDKEEEKKEEVVRSESEEKPHVDEKEPHVDEKEKITEKTKEAPEKKTGNPSPTETSQPKKEKTKLYQETPFVFSLVPGVEYSFDDTPQYRRVPRFALNLSGGSYIGVSLLEFGLLWNHEVEFMKGGQAAIGANIVEGNVSGVQFAGLFNLAGKESRGVQISGLLNLSSVHFTGVQMSGLSNISDNATGLQLSLFNFGHHLKGAQIGLLNYGAKVGYQIGLLNISKDSEASIGIINVNSSRKFHPLAWIGSSGDIIVGTQQRNGFLQYSLLSGIYTEENTAIRIGGGIGMHLGKGWYWDNDFLLFEVLKIGDSLEKLSLNAQLQSSTGYEFSGFSLFGGIEVNTVITGISDADSFLPDPWIEFDFDSARKFRIWPGVHVGLKL